MRWGLLLSVIAACGSTSEPSVGAQPEPRTFPIDVPVLKDVGSVQPWVEDKTTLSLNANSSGIVLEGDAIAPITNGAVDPVAVEGGAVGIQIVKLTQLTQRLADEMAKRGTPVGTVGVMFDRKLTYRVLYQAIYSMKRAGVKKYAVLARSGNELYPASIVLPEKKPMRSGRIEKIDPDVVAKLTEPGAKGGLKIVSKSTKPDASLTADIIAAKIHAAYTLGVERCGRKTGTPSLVKLSFRVNPEGHAWHADGTGPGAVLECITSQVTSWRFPKPKTADGLVTEIEAVFEFEITPRAEDATNKPKPTGTNEIPDEPIAVQLPDEQPLGMIVSASKSEVLVWSFSQLEGSLKAPRARFPIGEGVAAKVGAELHDIVRKRWSGKPRDPATREIVLMADDATPMQLVAELMFAMREASDHTMLFPDIMLSAGFQ